MINLFAELERSLATGQKAALARIIRQSGSAPRTVGTKMLIRADGSLVGTIGGGLLEHVVIGKAREVLSSGKSAVLHVQMSGQEVAASDMLCGGMVDVYIEAFSGENGAAREVFRAVTGLLTHGQRGRLVTLIAEASENSSPMLIAEDGSAIGELFGSHGSISIDATSWANLRTPSLVTLEGRYPQTRFFIEPIGGDPTLYLFGGGHVSACVAPLAKMVGFRVSVIDDRAEFANRARFPDVDEILACGFVEAFRRVAITRSGYIAIITRGHLHDLDVLRAALQIEPQPAYIGMIGSLRKRDMIYRSLLEEGIDRTRLERVHSPIGLPIRAESPEEIAVSIVAELIRVRAQGAEHRAPSGENRR